MDKRSSDNLQEVEADRKTTRAEWIREAFGQDKGKRYEETFVHNECFFD